MSVPFSSLNHISSSVSWPFLSNMVDCIPYTSSPLQVHRQMSMVKTVIPKVAFICSSRRVCPIGEQHLSVYDAEAPDAGEYNKLNFNVDSFENNNFNNEKEVVDYSPSLETLHIKVLKERVRRTKIGLANKGRVPWNKGRKHTAETRERIKQRTLEALRDPKVRKKMSEHPHSHSDQVKAKISSSLRRVWLERFKFKQLRERFFLSWAQSIANAARKGGNGQQELDWDSYDMIKRQSELHQILQAEEKEKEKQMAIAGPKNFIRSWTKSIAEAAKKGGSGEQVLDWDSYDKIEQEMLLTYQLQRAAEKAKAKEIAKMRAEKAAQIKAIKKLMLTQKRKDCEVRTKARKDRKNQPYRKAGKNKGDVEVAQEFKVSQRLTEIRIRKNVQLASEGDTLDSIFPTCKKLDLELIKREKMRKEVSLADQIRAARNQKGKIH